MSSSGRASSIVDHAVQGWVVAKSPLLVKEKRKKKEQSLNTAKMEVPK